MSHHHQACPHGGFKFLSLPADIRVEIYKTLLGRKILHFNDYFPELGNGGIFLCKSSIPDLALSDKDEHLKVIKVAKIGCKIDLQSRHMHCYSDWDGLQLQFLQVCRLIYIEASLVPFTENVFTFQSPKTVASFHARLQEWQAGAVDKVILHQQDRRRYWTGLLNCRPPEKDARLLYSQPFFNLRQLTIVIQRGFGCESGICSIHATHAEIQDAIVADMRKLASTTLENVNVLIVAGFESEEERFELEASALEAWASRTRTFVMDYPRTGSRDGLSSANLPPFELRGWVYLDPKLDSPRTLPGQD